jgi:hypothetical protein
MFSNCTILVCNGELVCRSRDELRCVLCVIKYGVEIKYMIKSAVFSFLGKITDSEVRVKIFT